jgi:hypothetical protein
MKRIAGTAVKTGVIALALALSGCGGGGGADAPAAGAPPAPVAQRDIQGTAAKGLIKGARVSVHALDAQGVRATAALATAVTVADGTYKLQVPLTVRAFVIEVSAAPGAVMADEVSGTDIALPEGMKLRNVVTLAENATGTYTGTVSPLTEMVARTAQDADGKLPPQAVAQAKTSVRTLLGFDPETVRPVNSNSDAAASASEDEKNQSLALAAISKMASTQTADCGQNNTGERIACVVDKLASSVTVKDGQPTLDPARLAQFRDAVEAVAQDKKINRTGKDKVVGVPVLTPPPSTPPTTPTEPTTPTTPTEPKPPVAGPVEGTTGPIEAAKTLFGSLRTNLRALGEGEAFRSTADAIKADLNGAVAPLANDVGGLATLVGSAVDLLDHIRNGGFHHDDVEVLRNHVRNAPVAQLGFDSGQGTCHFTKIPLTIFCSVIQNPSLPGSVVTGSDSGTRVFTTRSFKLTPREGSNTAYDYAALLEKYTLQYQGTNVVGTPTRETIGGTYSGQMTVARSSGALTGLVLNGRMPGRLNAAGGLDSDYEEWGLATKRAPDGEGNTLTTFGGAFTAVRAGRPIGRVDIDDASFVRVARLESGATTAVSAANELRVTMRGIVGETTVDGTLRASDGKLDKSKTSHLPTRLSFDGSIQHLGASVFSGRVAITRTGYENFDVTAPVSATNFTADTVELGGTLAVPGRPALSLLIGATRTALDAADVSAQYRDGTVVINASVTARAGERHPLVKVASADGVAFSFSGTGVPVPVTKDGAVVAQLDLVKGIISYSDGSTESLL